MTTTVFGQIASRPRWRASPRANLRCLGLSALIAFAAGCQADYKSRYGQAADPAVAYGSTTDELGIRRCFFYGQPVTCESVDKATRLLDDAYGYQGAAR